MNEWREEKKEREKERGREKGKRSRMIPVSGLQVPWVDGMILPRSLGKQEDQVYGWGKESFRVMFFFGGW